VLGVSFLCHATATTALTGTRASPLPFDLRQPAFEGGERRIVGMADGDCAAMLSCHLLGLGEFFGNRGDAISAPRGPVSGSRGAWSLSRNEGQRTKRWPRVSTKRG